MQNKKQKKTLQNTDIRNIYLYTFVLPDGPAITLTILENRKHIFAHAPGTLNLTFTIDSFPTSNVTMFHNKVNLKTISNVTGQHIFTTPIKSCLDEGEYQVDAANEVGSDSASVIVNVTCKY